MEDRQRIGWKLVYVDHENDVLLVGDDPWEYVFKLIYNGIIIYLKKIEITKYYMGFVQGIRELRAVHKDPFSSRSAANELGWRFWKQRPSKPSL